MMPRAMPMPHGADFSDATSNQPSSLILHPGRQRYDFRLHFIFAAIALLLPSRRDARQHAAAIRVYAMFARR